MSELLRHDLIWCLRRLPKDVLKLLEIQHGAIFLAGGFLRSCIAREEVMDIDLFATTPEVSKAVAAAFAESRGKKSHETGNAWSIDGRPSVQFIHRWAFATPQECVASFDFTIASAAIWHDGKEWKSTCHERFYPDLAAKRLVYLAPVRNEDAGGSMLRLLKFYSRGYRAPLDTVGAVVARLARGIVHPESGAPVLPVDEQRAAKILTGLLRVVDPNIDPTHDAHLPSDEEKVEPTQEAVQ